MRALVTTALALSLAACSAFLEDDVAQSPDLAGGTLHALSYEAIDGTQRPFSEDAGKVLLIVNTASECGYTGQYEGLEALHREYGPRGLVVLGFPCNDFGGQEPGSLAEIQAFCKDTYDVTFPLAAKVQVKEGPGQSPVYAFLGGATGKLPGWNFGKYVVGKDGRPRGFWNSNVKPGSEELRAALETALSE